MPTYEKSIDVALPLRKVYDQWTQFESFPDFMAGVDDVIQTTDTTMHWVTSIGGVRREFDAEVIEQRPDERIAWRAKNGPAQAGMVTFEPLTDMTTRVSLRMELEPQGVAERAGVVTGAIDGRLQGDLNRFKEFIEERGEPTGSWRGTIEPGPMDNQTIGRTPR